MAVTTQVENERAIRALLEALCAAWSNGDASAYADCFTADCDYVTFSGMLLRGRQENADLHGALFRGVLKGTRISLTVETLEFVSDDVALVHTLGRGRKASRQVFVIVWRAGQWRIRSFQNTRLQPLSIWLTRRLQRRWSA